MNTVDALKKLYKTLAGKDYAGDPNPTDAEMISAIAKDASSGGSDGGSSCSIRNIIVEKPADSYDFKVVSGVTWEELVSFAYPHSDPSELFPLFTITSIDRTENPALAVRKGTIWTLTDILPVSNDPSNGINKVFGMSLGFEYWNDGDSSEHHVKNLFVDFWLDSNTGDIITEFGESE